MWGIPRAAFIPVVIVGILAIRLVVRNVSESRAAKGFRRTSAVVNLLLLVSIFIFIFLALAAPNSLIGWLPVLLAGCGLLIIVIFVRWLRKRVNFFRGVEMFTGTDTGFSIFAGLVLFMGQGALFYQLTAFFQKIQDMSVCAGRDCLCPLCDRNFNRYGSDSFPHNADGRAAHHRLSGCSAWASAWSGYHLFG